MEKFVGKWSMTKVPDNLDAMFQAMGLDEERRRLVVSLADFDFTYTDHGDDNWEQNFILPNGIKRDVKFKIGEEFDSLTLDGRPAKCFIKIEDGKFMEHYKTEPDVEVDMIKEVIGDEFVTTIIYKDISCVAKSRRI